mgnify:CR=1 FL=1
MLAQHLFGVACSGPFFADALFAEIVTAAPYADMTRAQFDEILAFVTNGGYALQAYPQYNRLATLKDGRIVLREARMARQYRMNIGTIVESPMMKVKLRNRTLGSIEENFVVNLSPGDTFLFGPRPELPARVFWRQPRAPRLSRPAAHATLQKYS